MSGLSRVARSRRRSAVIGGLVLVLFLGMVWVALTATNGLPGATRVQVKVAFDDVGGLRKGDDVRIADIRVGQVTRIALSNERPVVTLSFDGDRKIYKDATAVIAQRSALGQDYVNVAPGRASSGLLSHGQVITTGAAAGAQDLANVLDVLDAKTRAALRSTILQVGGGASGHAGDLNAIIAALPQELPDLAKISNALSPDNGANLTSLLAATNSLSRSFSGRQHQLTELTLQLTRTLAAIDTHNGAPLAKTLQLAPGTLISARQGLQALQTPLATTQAAMTSLQPGAHALGVATPNLRGLLRAGVRPLDKVPPVAGQAVVPLADLTTVMADARPLAPRLAEAVQRASTPLAVIAPYSPELSLFFTYATSALSQGDAAGHWFRFYPILSTESVDGTLPIQDPITARNAYPAPGQAAKDKKTTFLGTRK
jgi:phospholipid/cholesterol/gamma-HCH transport system substrate-binding protein